jgi:hypothetical protein
LDIPDSIRAAVISNRDPEGKSSLLRSDAEDALDADFRVSYVPMRFPQQLRAGMERSSRAPEEEKDQDTSRHD